MALYIARVRIFRGVARRSCSLPRSLCESQGPLHAICRLPLIPSLGLIAATNQVAGPIHKFALCPQSSTHYRVVFHNAYCLDIHCKGKNTVAVRDGAFSLFDMRKVVEGLYTVPNLKAFLELFIDETVSYHHQHRNSRTLPANEDDGNPISPMNIDAGPTPPDPYLPTQVSGYPSGASPMSRAGLGQGGSGGFAYPMTPPTAPGGPGSSNPATPASPHTSVLSQQQHYAMSPGAYPLASPPSIPGPSPSAVMKGTPSPGLVEGGSPFTSSMGLTMPSPGSRQWPGSPSMPGPSPVQRFGMAQSPGGSMGPSTHSPGSSGMTGQQGQVGSVEVDVVVTDVAGFVGLVEIDVVVTDVAGVVGSVEVDVLVTDVAGVVGSVEVDVVDTDVAGVVGSVEVDVVVTDVARVVDDVVVYWLVVVRGSIVTTATAVVGAINVDEVLDIWKVVMASVTTVVDTSTNKRDVKQLLKMN
eukprot:XP_011680221.1 PREDICTED: mediator of RNA polymerase II transcription subunit 14 [Strongylocentrotus purpuratus]